MSMMDMDPWVGDYSLAEETRSAQEALAPLSKACIGFIVINTVFVILRFVSRMYIRRLPLWWDDYTIIPAYLGNLGVCIAGLVIVHYETLDPYPAGVVIKDPKILIPVLKTIFAIQQFLSPGTVFTRISILFLYLRIFTGRVVRALTWISLVIVISMFFAYSIAAIFQCQPVPYFWTKIFDLGVHTHGTCFNIDFFYRSFSVPNIVMDAVIIAIPIPTVWKLRASRSRKIGLTLVFGIGILALVASCVRMETFMSISARVIKPVNTKTLIIWIVTEPGIYLITACLPAMHHLFIFLTPRMVRERTETYLTQSRYNRGGFDLDRPSTTGSTTLMTSKASFASTSTLPSPNLEIPAGDATTTAKSSRPRTFDIENQIPEGIGVMELRDIRKGEGIFVKKEIEISQEEQIENILGI